MTTPETRDAAVLAMASGESLIDYLERRGYLYGITDESLLREALSAGVVTGYIGFDPTAASLHVGHQLGMTLLGILQRFGHRPIALGGGGTALVGDPSGRTSTRDAVTVEEIESNLQSILPQFGQFLDFDGGRFGDNPSALLINNADWLLDLGYIEFLRDIGRHFSVNEMLTAETYKVRIDSGAGLNFVEFNYRIAQAYDFLHLYRELGCTLQLGGSDQWGNITAGVELIRRADSGKAFGLVHPLLTTASGQKMGKSAGNSIWLDARLTPPYDYYQYWINVDDRDVEKLLRLYTFVPDEDISDLVAVEGDALRQAKRVLARETTALAHGLEAASQAEQTARTLFTGSIDDNAAIPTIVVDTSETTDITLADLFIKAELVSSRSEARRMAKQGGLSMDGNRIEDVDLVFASPEPVLLKVGKKRFKRVEIR